MSGVQSLTVIVAGSDPLRFHAALSLAAANAALGQPTQLFLQAEAVSLLRQPIVAPDDDRYSQAGLPTLGELLGEALAMEVRIVACQSGLVLAGMTADDFPQGVETGGPIDVLRSEGRLLLA